MTFRVGDQVVQIYEGFKEFTRPGEVIEVLDGYATIRFTDKGAVQQTSFDAETGQHRTHPTISIVHADEYADDAVVSFGEMIETFSRIAHDLNDLRSQIFAGIEQMAAIAKTYPITKDDDS